MPFEKGHKKVGGRVKGSPDKRRTIFEAIEKIKTADGDVFDPVKMMVYDLNELPAMQRAELLLRFIEYLYPKQRNIELSTQEPIEIIVKRYGK